MVVCSCGCGKPIKVTRDKHYYDEKTHKRYRLGCIVDVCEECGKVIKKGTKYHNEHGKFYHMACKPRANPEGLHLTQGDDFLRWWTQGLTLGLIRYDGKVLESPKAGRFINWWVQGKTLGFVTVDDKGLDLQKGDQIIDNLARSFTLGIAAYGNQPTSRVRANPELKAIMRENPRDPDTFGEATMDSTRYNIDVKEWMTRPSTPSFDFHDKFNHGSPMPSSALMEAVILRKTDKMIRARGKSPIRGTAKVTTWEGWIPLSAIVKKETVEDTKKRLAAIAGPKATSKGYCRRKGDECMVQWAMEYYPDMLDHCAKCDGKGPICPRHPPATKMGVRCDKFAENDGEPCADCGTGYECCQCGKNIITAPHDEVCEPCRKASMAKWASARPNPSEGIWLDREGRRENPIPLIVMGASMAAPVIAEEGKKLAAQGAKDAAKEGAKKAKEEAAKKKAEPKAPTPNPAIKMRFCKKCGLPLDITKQPSVSTDQGAYHEWCFNGNSRNEHVSVGTKKLLRGKLGL